MNIIEWWMIFRLKRGLEFHLKELLDGSSALWYHHVA